MTTRMSRFSRMVVLICSFAMIAVLFFPIWKINLVAPQYPEGLVMKIWTNKLTGDIDVINGLNHYIGMKTLHSEDFIEFEILPYMIGGYAALGFLVFFLRRKSVYRIYAGLFVLIAIVSLVDFYCWEYRYGHNLDPTAPIQVPGMAYQPPLIGYKQMLNFSAFSIPDTGGWIFALCGILIVGTALIEWWKERKARKHMSRALAVFSLLMITMVFNGCSQAPQPIEYGSEECNHCKMTIMNPKFAAEIITAKNKVYKFDDVRCLIAFEKSDAFKNQKAAAIFVQDFSEPHEFIMSTEGYFLLDEDFKSPMLGNVAIFSDRDSMKSIQEKLDAQPITWEELKNRL